MVVTVVMDVQIYRPKYPVFTRPTPPTRMGKSWNRGNKEARVEKSDSAVAARFPCCGAVIIAGKRAATFPANNYILIGRPNNR